MSGKSSYLGYAEFLLSSEEDATVVGRSASSIAEFDAELDDWILDASDRPQEKRAEGAGRIAACRDHNLTKLDLSRLGLSSLPACIGKLYQLEWLVLVSNELTKLPDWVLGLRELSGLYLSCNRLQDLPAGLGDLARLERLRLDHNELESLPESITRLRALKQFSFGGNRVESMPEAIWTLPDLDADTLLTLQRMEQENRIAYLEHRTRNLSSLVHQATEVAQEVLTTSESLNSAPIETPITHQGLMGLLALQRAQLGSEEYALRSELDSLKIEIAVQNAQFD